MRWRIIQQHRQLLQQQQQQEDGSQWTRQPPARRRRRQQGAAASSAAAPASAAATALALAVLLASPTAAVARGAPAGPAAPTSSPGPAAVSLRPRAHLPSAGYAPTSAPAAAASAAAVGPSSSPTALAAVGAGIASSSGGGGGGSELGLLHHHASLAPRQAAADASLALLKPPAWGAGNAGAGHGSSRRFRQYHALYHGPAHSSLALAAVAGSQDHEIAEQHPQQQHSGSNRFFSHFQEQRRAAQRRQQQSRVRDFLLKAVGGGAAPAQVMVRPPDMPVVAAGAAAAAWAPQEQGEGEGEQQQGEEELQDWLTYGSGLRRGDAEEEAAAAGGAAAGLSLLGEGALYEWPSQEPWAQQQQLQQQRHERGEEAGVYHLVDTSSFFSASSLHAAPAATVAIRPPPPQSRLAIVRPPLPMGPSPRQRAAVAAAPPATKTKQGGLLSRAVKGYASLLERHYHLVSFVQATILGIIGDMIAQVVEVIARNGGLGAGGSLVGLLARFRPNLQRTGNVALLAAIIDGVVTPQYYDLMDRVSQKKTLRVIGLKLLVTLALYGPVTNGTFLAAVPVLEKGLGAFDPALWLRQLREITVRDVQLWSCFYPVNFTLVPRAFRPLANNLMGLLFLVILSVCAYGGAA